MRGLTLITLGWILVMLVSLKTGFLDPFSWDATYYHNQGVDYWALPKAFLNLLHGRSMYDTWGGEKFGPTDATVTWYLAHPAFAIFVMPFFAFFSPWVSYALFVLFSLALVFLAGVSLAACTDDAPAKRWVYASLFCSFPLYLTLYVGNMHAPLILSQALIFSGLFGILDGRKERGAKSVFVGMLISLLTKPVVLIMVPALLALKETRKVALAALITYFAVSLLCIAVRDLNPEGVGRAMLLQTALDVPSIKQHLNIYRNGFRLTPLMKDNAIHWFSMVALSDYSWDHIDIYSLAAFLNHLWGHDLPPLIYKLPILAVLVASLSLWWVKDAHRTVLAALWVVGGASLTFFLSYGIVWEYQYSSILPLVAALSILYHRGYTSKRVMALVALSALLLCLPSPFILFQVRELQSHQITLMRATRVVPALLLFGICLSGWIKELRASRGNSGFPGHPFSDVELTTRSKTQPV